jgi:glycosyltransferase involved in cell wall biosynthesis
MTNIVALVQNRPRLTKQMLTSLYKFTDQDSFRLTIVDDGSSEETYQLTLDMVSGLGSRKGMLVSFWRSVSILGFLRNIGAQVSEKVFGRGDWLCFLDNDVAVFEEWLPRLVAAIGSCSPKPAILGGQRHPYHQSPPIPSRLILEVDAVAGYSMFMSWRTWDRFGPFDANAKGIGQSEDWAFSQRVKKGGGIVGYIHPPVLSHTGLTNSDGKPATGHEAFERFPGLIYE